MQFLERIWPLSSSARALLVSLGTLVLISWGALDAHGDHRGDHWGQYSYRSDTCSATQRTDPITVYFYGSGVSISRLEKKFHKHFGWKRHSGWNQGESNQYFTNAAQPSVVACNENDSHYGSNAGSNKGFSLEERRGYSRWHIRYSFKWGGSGTFGHGGISFATPHRDVWQNTFRKNGKDYCEGLGSPWRQLSGIKGTHYVYRRGRNGRSGFDAARERVARRFSALHHRVSAVAWGNDHSMRQCNGQFTASSGRVYGIQIGR